MDAMKLAMEIFLDEEAGQWGYAVPALSIVGTGCRSKEEARRLGYEAIGKVLEAQPQTASRGAEIIMFDVEVTSATEAG
jgi:hypothetical protein